MINSEQILMKNLITEKATLASSTANQYYFKVSPAANKISVAQAVEKTFPNVNVVSVNILNVKPKAKRDRMRRNRMGKKPGYKKAIVTLKSGQTIDMI